MHAPGRSVQALAEGSEHRDMRAILECMQTPPPVTGTPANLCSSSMNAHEVVRDPLWRQGNLSPASCSPYYKGP